MLQCIYAHEPLPAVVTHSLFLAGPTPRQGRRTSWRGEAVDWLQRHGFSGVVFIPEPRSGQWTQDYDGQVAWETRMRDAADAIVFWVPRTLDEFPGFTTNVEFGMDLRTNKVLYGRPSGAAKTRYLDQIWAEIDSVAPYETLDSLLRAVLAALPPPRLRVGPEVMVPLCVSQTQSWTQWYRSLMLAGNRLDSLRVIAVFPQGPLGTRARVWMIHTNIWIPSEDRYKGNEIVVGRDDISAVVALAYPKTDQAEVLIVDEFRQACSTPAGRVIEPPSGSSDRIGCTPRCIALDELWEETTLRPDPSRLIPLGERQLAATILSHHAHGFALELNNDEIAAIRALEGKVLGAEDGERIVCRLVPIDALDGLDWTSIGLIAAARHALEGKPTTKPDVL